MEGLRPGWAVKAIVVIIITLILSRCVCASKHLVGGDSGWDLRSNFQIWSSATTFYVGDDLVFRYTPIHDVVEVNQIGYATCIISNALGTFDDGETVIHLTEPGTRYFVCGRLRHCQHGLKLQVQVLAQTNNGSDNNSGGGSQEQRGHGRDGRHFPPPISQSHPPRSAPPPSSASPSPTPSVQPPLPKYQSGDAQKQPGIGGLPRIGGLPSRSAAPFHCSGVRDGIADAPFLYHGLVPTLITLVILSLTHAQALCFPWLF